MNCLKDNLDKLHTTELGALRIRKNLDLSTSEVVEWCKEAIIQASLIMKLGKNQIVFV
jgi:intein-encoded DNA endonuclease-like protein